MILRNNLVEWLMIFMHQFSKPNRVDCWSPTLQKGFTRSKKRTYESVFFIHNIEVDSQILKIHTNFRSHPTD